MGAVKLSLKLSLLLAFASQYSTANVAITTSSVPNGIAETAYSAVITASGGCPPYKWAIVSGNLPTGVTATPSTSTKAFDLSGSPTQAASYSFTVSVTGCGGSVSRASYTIAVQDSPNNVVDLSWQASTSGNVVGYNMYRSPNGVTWKRINASLIAGTVYSDSTVANNTTYYYAATSVNVAGVESSKTVAVKVVVP
jgi:large repetitive protein